MNDLLKACDLFTYKVFRFVEKYFAILLPAYFLSLILGYYLAIWDINWAWIPWGIFILFVTLFYLACAVYYYIREKF